MKKHYKYFAIAQNRNILKSYNPVDFFEINVFSQIIKKFQKEIPANSFVTSAFKHLMLKFQKKKPINNLNDRVLLKSDILKPFDYKIYEKCFIDGITNGYLWGMLQPVDFYAGYFKLIKDKVGYIGNLSNKDTNNVEDLQEFIKYEEEYQDKYKYNYMIFNHLTTSVDRLEFACVFLPFLLEQKIEYQIQIEDENLKGFDPIVYRAIARASGFNLLRDNYIKYIKLIAAYIENVETIGFIQEFMTRSKEKARTRIVSIILFNISQALFDHKKGLVTSEEENMTENIGQALINIDYEEAQNKKLFIRATKFLYDELIFLLINEFKDGDWLESFLNSFKEGEQDFDMNPYGIKFILKRTDIRFVLSKEPDLFSFAYYLKKGFYNEVITAIEEGYIKEHPIYWDFNENYK